jgi:death-on-curing protein
MIRSTQKVIKVGSSGAVTIPAKEMKRLGITYGDELNVTFEPIEKASSENVQLVALTQRLIERHKVALKNLSQR